MDDKSKGFSLRQKKSKRVGPKQISAPISQSKQPASKPLTRPNVNGKPDVGNTADLVKRRYSTRFNQVPDFDSANAPPIPSVPILPNGNAKPGARAAQATADQGHKIPIDTNALKSSNFQTEKYSTAVLADASDQDLRDYQSTLQKLKNRASSDLQQNVYQNRTQFIKISKEAEKLKGEMRILRGLMSELTSAMDQASINAGVPEPRIVVEDTATSRARKQANRSSVANLEAIWNTQLHTLWKQVEGSQKYLPAIPGRHIVNEQNDWLELDAATWKARRHAHMILLNDHLLIATKKKKRVDPNSDAKRDNTTRIVADRCWPLQDIDMTDLASTGSSKSDKGGMSNAISIRCGNESFTYRSDKPTDAEKMELLQDFRRSADELRRAMRAEMEEHSNKTRENMDYLTTKDPSLADKGDLLRKLSDASPDRPDIMIEVDGKHQNLRWVEGQIDELDSEVALQRFEDAVRRIEKLRKVAKGLKGNTIAQDLITTKVDERAQKLAGQYYPNCSAFQSTSQLTQQPSLVRRHPRPPPHLLPCLPNSNPTKYRPPRPPLVRQPRPHHLPQRPHLHHRHPGPRHHLRGRPPPPHFSAELRIFQSHAEHRQGVPAVFSRHDDECVREVVSREVGGI